MEVLERALEYTGTFFNSILRGFERGVTKVFGTSNERVIRRYQARVEGINSLEPTYQAMSDDELKKQTEILRQRLREGETLDDILIEAFAVCREGGRRFLNMRHYDVQLIGGMVLHGGSIAEMVTGEGKTLVATLPCYLNALEGQGVHVVTVNDYLARRDMEWMAPLYMGLGLTVGAIQSDMDVDDRQKAYDCDITYGTNNEFGFDYLRDNMRPAARGDNRFPKNRQQSQGELNFAIIDEVDNILIDEARTPLIISGPAFDDVGKYPEADRIARQLRKDTHFTVNEKDHSVHLTEEGVREGERLAGVESFYTAGNMQWPHLIDNALKAHHLYKRDVNYVSEGGSIIIVDEFTGRKMEGRQWSDGLHQAVEAKEGVRIKEETQTLATITLQNFFKLYKKICGMTGTAMTEAGELFKIYKLDVVAIPTNRSMQRITNPDVIYRSEREKYEAVANEIERIHRWDVLVQKNGEEVLGELIKERDDAIEFKPQGDRQSKTFEREKVKRIEPKGRPILVGTVSIEKSERLSNLLERRGVKHQVLNAKHHRREAEIIAQAGRPGAVTIATNMAGRGTDIILGGNPDTMAWAMLQDKYPTRLEVPKEEWDSLVKQIDEKEKMKETGKYVKELGGLHVIGTERHEARRIDLQLRGRCGRQGDPGSSRFFLSLEDDLMRVFAGPWVKTMLERFGMQEGDAIESRMVTRQVEGAQKKVEERNFEVRKNLLEYDEVMDQQRRRIYGFRQSILEGESCREVVFDQIKKVVNESLSVYLDKNYAVDTYAKWAGGRLSAEFEGRDFRGMNGDDAADHARKEAERQAETQVHDAIDENLPGSEEEVPGDWNWQALANMVNSRWKLNVKDRDLKKMGRDDLSEELLKIVREKIGEIDLSEGNQVLEDDFAITQLRLYMKARFGIDVPVQTIRELETGDENNEVVRLAQAAYERREAEFPVLAGVDQFSTSEGRGQPRRVDREALLNWARPRFNAEFPESELRTKLAPELIEVLIARSRECQEKAEQALVEIKEKVDEVFVDSSPDETALAASNGNGVLSNLSQWIESHLQRKVSPEELGRHNRDSLGRKLSDLVEDRYRPEMRRMERRVLLEVVDTAWKDHLYVMDRLRNSIGLVSYAQVDPKVEYKREGMRLFDEMWESIADRVVGLVFRIEQFDEDFVSSTWVETSATHAAAESTSDIARQQQQAIDGTQRKEKVEPIRNRHARIGRNDPCHCGSGKKYKNCHMRTDGVV